MTETARLIELGQETARCAKARIWSQAPLGSRRGWATHGLHQLEFIHLSFLVYNWDKTIYFKMS